MKALCTQRTCYVEYGNPFYKLMRCVKGRDGMEKSVNPDQSAPLGEV